MFAKTLVIVLVLTPLPLAAQQAKAPPPDRKIMLERALRQYQDDKVLEAELKKRALPRVPSPLIVVPR